MSILCTVRRIISGKQAVDGAGVRLVRVFGNHDVEDMDPFLMLDAFDSKNPDDYIKGFPWHPHRGIETITYLVSGDIEHGDSLGNKGSIRDGDCQWMTAGSGIIHQEMPQASERILGVQLWLNLPAKDKMTLPKYRDITKAKIPVVEEDHIKIHIISGYYNDVAGAIQGDYVKPLYLDVELNAGEEFSLPVAMQDKMFIYIFYGSGCFTKEGNDFIHEKNAVLFNSGDIFFVKAAEKNLRFILLAAKPVKEPVAWGGPIVMNTKAELDQAFKELDNGTFVKHGAEFYKTGGSRAN